MISPLRVVLTGGPCGGKTTAIKAVAKHFRDQGRCVFTSPEIPTLLHEIGIDLVATMTPADEPSKTYDKQQKLLIAALELQLALETHLFHLTEFTPSNARPLILFDRGIIDFKSYYPAKMWEDIRLVLDIDRDHEFYCYDLVMHLTTTAIGAEHAYNNDNPARNCAPELARQLDTNTRKAWTRDVVVIDNSTNFEGKLQRIIKNIENQLAPAQK